MMVAPRVLHSFCRKRIRSERPRTSRSTVISSSSSTLCKKGTLGGCSWNWAVDRQHCK